MVLTVRKDMLYRMLEDRTATYLTNHKRDWIHVKDVARAIRYLAVSDLTNSVPVGTGNGVYVTELDSERWEWDIFQ